MGGVFFSFHLLSSRIILSFQWEKLYRKIPSAFLLALLWSKELLKTRILLMFMDLCIDPSIPFLTHLQPISEGAQLLAEVMAGQFCIPHERWGHDNSLPALIAVFQTHKRPTHQIALIWQPGRNAGSFQQGWFQTGASFTFLSFILKAAAFL